MSSLSSKVTISPDVLHRDLDGESVALNMASGKYYGLDGVATRMWALLAERGSLRDVLDVLNEEYDADRSQLERDLIHLVDELESQGLVEVVEG